MGTLVSVRALFLLVTLHLKPMKLSVRLIYRFRYRIKAVDVQNMLFMTLFSLTAL
jgi:hypothetical protein